MPPTHQHQFRAQIGRVAINACVDVPLPVSRALAPYATAGRVRVDGTLNGSSFRATMLPTAGGPHRIYINEAMQRRAGVKVGDLVRLAISPASPEELTPPPVAARLKQIPGAREAFDALAPSHRRELLRYIDEAKTDSSRDERIRKAAEHVLGRPVPTLAKSHAAKVKARPLWTCPKCGNKFVNKNNYHSCKRRKLSDVFRGKPPEIRRLFDRFRKMVEACGPVTMLPYHGKVGFMVRVRFGGATPAAKWLDVGFWLPRRIEHPRIRKIETIYPNVHLHRVRVTRPEDFDDQLAGWIREAYAVGCQEHLGS